MDIPVRFEIIGDSLALKWSDGTEDFWRGSFLRKHSPSAEQTGEMDIFGRIQGGTSDKDEYKEVKLLKLFPVGNYALRLLFSDGHSTGIYSWSYLRNLPKENANS